MPRYESTGTESAVLPQGTYNFKIGDVEVNLVKSGKNQGNPMLVVWFHLLSNDEHAGTKVRASFLMRNTEGEMPKPARYSLFDLLRSVGDKPSFDTDEVDFEITMRKRLSGKVLALDISHKMMDSGKVFPEIAYQGYHPALPDLPTEAATATPAVAKPKPVQAAPKGETWDEDIPF